MTTVMIYGFAHFMIGFFFACLISQILRDVHRIYQKIEMEKKWCKICPFRSGFWGGITESFLLSFGRFALRG